MEMEVPLKFTNWWQVIVFFLVGIPVAFLFACWLFGIEPSKKPGSKENGWLKR